MRGRVLLGSLCFLVGMSLLYSYVSRPSAAQQFAARGALPDGLGSPATCGDAGLSDCPLQQWMKATLQTYQREVNFARLATALDALQARAPEGYGHWSKLAGGAASAARNSDAPAVREACKACHSEYRARYRRERRNAAWP
jgi:hypothetical protein